MREDLALVGSAGIEPAVRKRDELTTRQSTMDRAAVKKGPETGSAARRQPALKQSWGWHATDPGEPAERALRLVLVRT